MIAAVLDGDEAADVAQESGGNNLRHLGDVVLQGTDLAVISDNAIDLRHVVERRRIKLGRAARDEDTNVGALPLRLADRLPRLSDGFVGHRAAVDDDPIFLGCRQPANGLALRKVQPATERNRFDAHPNVPRSISPLKT